MTTPQKLPRVKAYSKSIFLAMILLLLLTFTIKKVARNREIAEIEKHINLIPFHPKSKHSGLARFVESVIFKANYLESLTKSEKSPQKSEFASKVIKAWEAELMVFEFRSGGVEPAYDAQMAEAVYGMMESYKRNVLDQKDPKVVESFWRTMDSIFHDEEVKKEPMEDPRVAKRVLEEENGHNEDLAKKQQKFWKRAFKQINEGTETPFELLLDHNDGQILQKDPNTREDYWPPDTPKMASNPVLHFLKTFQRARLSAKLTPSDRHFSRMLELMLLEWALPKDQKIFENRARLHNLAPTKEHIFCQNFNGQLHYRVTRNAPHHLYFIYISPTTWHFIQNTAGKEVGLLQRTYNRLVYGCADGTKTCRGKPKSTQAAANTAATTNAANAVNSSPGVTHYDPSGERITDITPSKVRAVHHRQVTPETKYGYESSRGNKYYYTDSWRKTVWWKEGSKVYYALKDSVKDNGYLYSRGERFYYTDSSRKSVWYKLSSDYFVADTEQVKDHGSFYAKGKTMYYTDRNRKDAQFVYQSKIWPVKVDSVKSSSYYSWNGVRCYYDTGDSRTCSYVLSGKRYEVEVDTLRNAK